MSFSIFGVGNSPSGSEIYDLGDHTIPYALNWPTAPQGELSVSNVSTIGELQFAAEQNSIEINIPSGVTLIGDVDVTGTDVKINCPNNSTVQGVVTFGDVSRPARQWWHGGNIDGAINVDRIDDLTITNLHWSTSDGETGGNWTIGTAPGFARVALANCTFDGDTATLGWFIFTDPGDGQTDLIMCNVLFNPASPGYQNLRLQGITRLTVVDCYACPQNNVTAMRVQQGNQDVYIADSIIGNSLQWSDATNLHMLRVKRFQIGSNSFASGGTGMTDCTVNECPLWSTPFAPGTGDGTEASLPSGVTGSDNIIESNGWDGSSMPDPDTWRTSSGVLSGFAASDSRASISGLGKTGAMGADH